MGCREEIQACRRRGMAVKRGAVTVTARKLPLGGPHARIPGSVVSGSCRSGASRDMGAQCRSGMVRWQMVEEICKSLLWVLSRRGAVPRVVGK